MRTRSLGLVLASAAASVYASSSWNARDNSHHFRPHTREAALRNFERRNIVSESDLQDSYDFIIVGGGTAGLAIASRLSEDSNHTVLVLEAGDTGDAVIEQILIPGDTYYDGLGGTSYEWQYSTVPQTSAANQNISWPRGKVLGGSSAVNGLYSVRPSQLEHDTWASLQDGADGANAWNWSTQFGFYKKAETFTAPDSSLESAFTLEYSTDSHGASGPVDVSWPTYELPIVGNWSSTLNAVGIPTNQDPYGGSNTGAFIALSAINPSNHTRSYARSAYIDPLPSRSNLAILANALVTNIEFSSTKDSDGNVTATGVTYQLTNASSTSTVSVNKEVILCGGAIGSPQVLMLSGVGPSDVLSAAGVTTVVDLPGVGQHLQDHIAAGISWNTDASTYASLRDAGDTDSGFLSYVNEAEAYVNLSTLFGSDLAQTYQQQVSSNIDTNASSLVPSTDSTVIEGYKSISQAVADTFMLSDLGHVELLLSAQGQKGSSSQTIEIQCALQHPLSQGRIYITSSDPTAAPAIDPWYLSHPFDLTSLVQCFKFARTIGGTAPLSNYLTSESSPGSSVSSDADWETWVKESIQTEYHPANTCAMLPLSKGGVVSPKLIVYGTSNVRVADASVTPFQFASHLMMSVYAIGETASSIIRADYNGGLAPGETASTGSSSSASAAGASSTSANNKSSAAMRSVSMPRSIVLLFAMSVLSALVL